MRPTWLLSGQGAGSLVLRPVLLGTTLLGVLEMLARYFRVAETVLVVRGKFCLCTDSNRSQSYYNLKSNCYISLDIVPTMSFLWLRVGGASLTES